VRVLLGSVNTGVILVYEYRRNIHMFEKIAIGLFGVVMGYATHVLLFRREDQRTIDALKDSNVLLERSIKVVTEQQELLRKADEALSVAKAATQEEVISLTKSMLQKDVKDNKGDSN
jgi:hypothetical protein